MKWPRGKHNGRRIVGFRVNVLFDITIPLTDVCHPFPLRYGRCLGLGPLRIWFHPEYESEHQENARRAKEQADA